MRGKYIFSLSMVVVLFGFLLTGISVAQATPTISINPVEVLKNPGDVFILEIVVSDVVDLYTYAFELKYAPFTALLLVQTIKEGPFLGSDGEDTDFSASNNAMAGVLVVGNTRIGEVPGISGSGVIAYVTFKVKTTGTCALTLASTDLIDSHMIHITHDVVSGMFYTPYAKVTKAEMTGLQDNSGVAVVGSTLTLTSTVKNTVGTVPLTVKVAYVLTRTDGTKITIWSPQPRTIELNVNGFTDQEEAPSTYTMVGASPYLDAVGDGNYIEGRNELDYIWYFDLSDLTLLPTEQITGVYLEAYSKADMVGAKADVIVNTIDADTAVGAIEPGTDWDWYFTPIEGAMESAFHDEESINSARLLIMSTVPTITIDAIRVFVTVEEVIVVQPGQTVTMPTVYYTTTMADKGKYPSVKAYCYYSYMGSPFFREVSGLGISVIGSGPNPKIRHVLIINPPKPGQGNI